MRGLGGRSRVRYSKCLVRDDLQIAKEDMSDWQLAIKSGLER